MLRNCPKKVKSSGGNDYHHGQLIQSQCLVKLTNLGANCIIANHLEHVEQEIRVGVTTCDIAQTCHEPISDTRRPLSIRPEQQELLKKGVCQDCHKLGGQLDLVKVLDKGLGVVNLFQGYGPLGVVRNHLAL